VYLQLNLKWPEHLSFFLLVVTRKGVLARKKMGLHLNLNPSALTWPGHISDVVSHVVSNMVSDVVTDVVSAQQMYKNVEKYFELRKNPFQERALHNLTTASRLCWDQARFEEAERVYDDLLLGNRFTQLPWQIKRFLLDGSLSFATDIQDEEFEIHKMPFLSLHVRLVVDPQNKQNDQNRYQIKKYWKLNPDVSILCLPSRML